MVSKEDVSADWLACQAFDENNPQLAVSPDIPNAAPRPIIDDLFDNVRQIHFKAYNAYFQFNICKWSWLQVAVLFPYLALTPTILAGTITLGVVSQTVRAFGKVGWGDGEGQITVLGRFSSSLQNALGDRR